MNFFVMFKRCNKGTSLKSLKVGDIIWARRYKGELEKDKIKKGHQESPYVIIKKVRGKVYGLQVTSNPHQEIKWNMLYYPLGRFSYNLMKVSFVDCLSLEEINKYQFVEKIGHLTDYDLNQLKKQLYIIINSGYKDKQIPIIEKKYLDFKIGIGDIILYNGGKYYIDEKVGRNYRVYRLRNKIKKGKSILINNTYYSFVFETSELIKTRFIHDLVGTFNTGEIEIINGYKASYMHEFNNNINSDMVGLIGAIIDYKNAMYYVYDEDEEKVSVYQVYGNGYKKKGMVDILIKGGIYRTFFSYVDIPKDKLSLNGYKVRRRASNEEIVYNSKLVYVPKKLRDNKNKRLAKDLILRDDPVMDTDGFVPMTILKNVKNKKYYLVISRVDNILELININDMKDYFYYEVSKFDWTFKYYRVLSKEEFDKYIDKIQEYKDLISSFSR